MQTSPAGSGVNEFPLAMSDLGPLAWVLEEVRKSLEGASKSLRRFAREADPARGANAAGLDTNPLRMARQYIHQSVGALEMVGLVAPANVLRAMETAAQRFLDKPELCTEAAASKIERCGFALAEYLESVLGGKPVSAVSLFPQYREVQELAASDRIHPADLWATEWKGAEPELPLPQPLSYGPEVRGRIDRSVLGLIKKGDKASASDLRDVSLGLAAAEQSRQARVFWKISAAYFDALANGLIAADVYTKRVTSRILLQYTALARGDRIVSDRLMQDLLFFCAQAGQTDGAAVTAATTLSTVRQACGLGSTLAVDYEVGPFGRFDPAVLAQARKRIESAKDSWSALAGGDTGKAKIANDQFHLVSESLVKLHPPSAPLAQALNRTLDGVQRSGGAPGTELAIEVATAVLFLEAAFEDLDPSDPQLEIRTRRLAERLERVRGGGTPEALEPWMEDLYRRVSDRQTMGTVVGELRVTLGELEKSLDQFFRNPAEKGVLREVPGHLAQMRGVMSVLGLDQASQTVLRMRDSVEQILETDVDEARARAAGTFDKLGNNIGALGFLIDMLNYQPALAKKLFVFDEALGELRPLMGRTVESEPVQPGAAMPAADDLAHAAQAVIVDLQNEVELPARLDQLAAQAALADQHELAKTARQAAVAVSGTDADAAAVALEQLATVTAPAPQPELVVPSDYEEDDLRDIFLEEAREVVQGGREALDGLSEAPADTGLQTTLRRAFHTLKGSSRMVGLNEFGEAAWSMEQLLNNWLAEQKPISRALHQLCTEAFAGLGAWVEDIAVDRDQAWKAAPFRHSADAMRTENRVEPLVLPGTSTVEDPPSPPLASDVAAFPEFADFDFATLEDANAPASLTVPMEITDIDLSSLSELSSTPADAPSPAQAAKLPTIDVPSSAPPLAPIFVDLPDTDFAPPVDDVEAIDLDLSFAQDTTPAPFAPEVIESESADDQVKIIDSLRVNLPLYNVYLGEADEWSRRLVTELAEWAMELHQPMPDSAIALAHSLAGSSATVGFTALSEMARLLEHALQHAQVEANGTPRQGRVFSAVAEDIRHLLHQFAAGFLKEPNPEVLEALRNLQADDAADEAQAVLSGLPEAVDAHPERTAPHLHVVSGNGQADSVPSTPEPNATAPEPSTPVVASYATFAAPRPFTPTAATAPGERTADLDVDDDLDAVDAIDPDLFPIFEEEAAELLPQLGGALRQWAARPGNLGARNEALRTLHTLKGSARLAGAMRLGELAHRMESEIEEIGHDDLIAAQIEPLLGRFDTLQANFDGLRMGADAPASDVSPQPESAVVDEAPVVSGGSVEAVPGEADKPATRTEIALPAQTVLAPLRQGHQQAVRVRSHLLDRLVTQAGEVMITRSRLEAELGQLRGSLGDLTGNLDRLRSQLRDIELQAETQMQSRLAQAKDSQQGFDPLEFDRFTRVQELTRMMAESVNDVATVQRNIQRTVEATEDDLNAQARQTRELQRDLLRTRMVEFEGISERLYRVIRQAAKDTGKQVKLDITGGSIEMDRGVLDRMTPAFEHLLRNCVAHGIEDPQQRTAAGKDAIGTITVDLHHEGNDVAIAFTDDGAGLNLPRIREKAAALGLLESGHDLSDTDVANLIFLPGFSTAADVTELAGRGIGMDVVRAEVNALGGRIETSTEAGRGTTFRMVLPLTTAVTQVVMLRFGTQSIGVPSNVVEIVRRAPAKEVQQAYNSGTLDYSGESVPFFWAGALLQASQRSTELHGKTLPVVVLRSAAQRVALHVDEVLGNQEVVVKNLGPQLSRLPGLAGMTVLASGAVVLIYNPVALASVYGAQARSLSADHAQPDMLGGVSVPVADGGVLAAGAPSQVPLVMVVDDSITVRRVTQRLLQREGYRVVLAADGLQALERLQDERPAVVLSDIEMPRMDGFDLARNIRGDRKFQDLPIIMITSRIATKHRDHAMELGVNHYLGKPYPEDELLSLVRRYTHAELQAI